MIDKPAPIGFLMRLIVVKTAFNKQLMMPLASHGSAIWTRVCRYSGIAGTKF
jgi:hypothetical protein